MQALGASSHQDNEADFSRIEVRWLEALKRDSPGDVASILEDLMPAIRAEAISRRAPETPCPAFEALLCDAQALVSSIRGVLNHHEAFAIDNSFKNYPPRSPYIWKIWPVDAVENGAPEWHTGNGGWYTPVARIELEEYIHDYLRQPWLSHSTLDWALLGGWLLGAAHELHNAIENDFLSSEVEFVPGSPGRKFGDLAAAKLALVASPQGGAPLRHVKFPFGWKHAACCSVVSIALAAMFPKHYVEIALCALGWLAFNRWFTVSRGRTELTALANKIDRYRDMLQEYKAAWLATNTRALDVSRLFEKIEAAKQFGLALSPGAEAPLKKIGSDL